MLAMESKNHIGNFLSYADMLHRIIFCLEKRTVTLVTLITLTTGPFQ